MYAFIPCRALLGHAWHLLHCVQNGRHIVARMQCERCKMKKEVQYNTHGVVDSRDYTQPRGYHVKGGVNKASLRAEFFKRRLGHGK